MSEYLDTQLLECNRLHSEEYKSGNKSNPALWSNKLGSGIKLDVGDTISVHSGYISEYGAGGNTIEFKGASLGKIKTYTVSNVSNTLPYDEDSDNKRINGYKRTIIRDEQIDRELFDNKASIKIGYYLNTMGQNTLQLPRRYAGRHTSTDSANNFTQIDEVENGLPFFNRYIIVDADYKEYYKNTQIFKQKIDNKRFTIFARDTSVFDKAADFTYEDPAGVNPNVTNMWMRFDNVEIDPYVYAENPRNPAFWNYREYSELIDLEVNAGFNDAENVAEQLTNQLTVPIKETNFTAKLYDPAKDVYETIIKTIETKTYKPFNCGSVGNMSLANYTNFESASLALQISQESYDYMSSYQYVGHKRPEIQTAGRNLPHGALPWIGFAIAKTINVADRLTSPISIKVNYNSDNCAKFGDFFKACELYPELWDNLNPRGLFPTQDYDKAKIKFETTRWLHLNNSRAAEYLARIGEYYLGSDNFQTNGSAVIWDAPPVFFEYDSNSRDIFYDKPSRDKLSYGCMDKDDEGHIKFYTENIGGIAEFFFKDNGSGVFEIEGDTLTVVGRRIGFDFSFQAWSTLAILPFSGFNFRNKDNQDECAYQQVDFSSYDTVDLSGITSQVYLGAQSPLIEYDASRFKISQLHSLLRQQQNFKAGLDDDNPDLGAAVAGAYVYKLNPIDNYVVYTPDIVPFQDKKRHAGGPTGFLFTQLNLNLEPWLIYDSYSGIFISDFGFDDDEGLWSVLGFVNSQFNSPLTASNTLSNNRFDNNTIKTLNKVTTNAEITSKDFSSFIQNIYGGTMYTQQITTVRAVVENSTSIKALNYFAPVSVAQNSIKIVAKNLPRRMLRPYYLLKTNLVDKNSLIGSRDSGQNFNVAAVIDKQYSGGDFFFFTANAIDFTITKPITLTKIETSVHDPDGSFANVNSDSSVIYKVQKSKNLADLNILSQILQNKK